MQAPLGYRSFLFDCEACNCRVKSLAPCELVPINPASFANIIDRYVPANFPRDLIHLMACYLPVQHIVKLLTSPRLEYVSNGSIFQTVAVTSTSNDVHSFKLNPGNQTGMWIATSELMDVRRRPLMDNCIVQVVEKSLPNRRFRVLSYGTPEVPLVSQPTRLIRNRAQQQTLQQRQKHAMHRKSYGRRRKGTRLKRQPSASSPLSRAKLRAKMESLHNNAGHVGKRRYSCRLS